MMYEEGICKVKLCRLIFFYWLRIYVEVKCVDEYGYFIEYRFRKVYSEILKHKPIIKIDDNGFEVHKKKC